ncbi:uncharacterized protein LOC144903637 [Branchiostoma floridae x Branchiostoma belcheri]
MAKLIGIMHSANFSLVLCTWFLMFLSNTVTSQTTDITLLTSVKLNTTVATIDLSNSSLTSIPPDFFKNQSHLQQVDLSNNQISYLNGSIFTALVNLETLILSNNAIKTITVNVFRNLTNLMLMDLSQNSIRDLPDNLFVDNINLQVLNLDGNNISEVRRDTFVGLRSLKLLFLNTSGLSSIHSSSFTPLVELEELYLQENHIDFQEDYTGITANIFRNLQNLRLLDLSKNSITFLPEYMFLGLIKLEVLHLDGNKFSTIRRDTFVGLRSLKLLFLNTSGLSSIEVLSFTPLMLELEELYLQENDISFQGRFQGTSGITPYIFRNLLNLRLLDLSKNSITFLPDSMFEDLRKLEVLRLDGNNFLTIRAFTLYDLRSLQKLFLNDTGLSIIHPLSFQHTWVLKELFLQDNNITYLPWEDLQELNLTVLDLGNNLWSEEYSCDQLPNCTFNNFYPIHYEHLFFNQFVYMYNAFSCCNGTLIWSCGVNPSIGLCTMKSFVTMIETPPPETWYMYILNPYVALVVVFIIIMVLYCNRKYLQVWLYIKCGWRFDPKDDGDDKTYDAFISYSSRDELIVIRELAPGLEERGFKLCLHYRDFPVGACIATTIIETVEASRRTVILLSQNFVDSEWCALEFKAAHRQVLEDRRNRIVMIVLDDLDLKNVDKDLKFYLKTNTYLKWGDPWFWSKLCYALPRVGRGAPESHDLMSEEVTTSDVNMEMPEFGQLVSGYDTSQLIADGESENI